MSIAGVDGCRGGWLAVIQEGTVKPTTVHFLQTFGDVFDLLPDLEIVAVDMPIGLPDNSPDERACDKEARRLLGRPRGSSVFPAPGRAVLDTDTYDRANILGKTLRGKGLSKQTFAIMPKIREVDQVVRRYGQVLVREVHPEVCFWAMNNCQTLSYNKKKKEGKVERRALLDRAFDHDAIDWCDKKRYGTGATLDDLYDAMAALWSARRILLGISEKVPATPEVDAKGLVMEINY